MLIIAQMQNPGAGRLRQVLELSGSLLPLDSLDFGVSQRATIEWLPGSGVASVHLDGPEEDPTDVQLRLVGRDFRVGDAKLDGRDLRNLDEVVDALSGMVRDRVLVEVLWRGRSQRAVLQRFVPSEGLEQEWGATLTLAWVDAPGKRAQWGPPASSPASFAAQLQAGFDEAMADVRSAVTFAQGPVEEAEAAVSRVRENLSAVSQAAGSLRDTAASVAGIQKSIADTLAQLMVTTNDVFESLVSSPEMLAQSNEMAQQILARAFRSQTLRAARLVRQQAVLERRNYRPESDVMAIHTGVQGETVWSVARLWYGDPALGPAIARRNQLISTAIRAGQRLVIPRRDWLDRESRTSAPPREDERRARRSYDIDPGEAVVGP